MILLPEYTWNEFDGVRFPVADPEIDYQDYEARQRELLAAFVRDTATSCAFHRDRFARADLDARRFEFERDFHRIPILTVDQVRMAGEARLLPDRLAATLDGGGHSLPVGERPFRRFSTTGTTGAPKVSHYTARDWWRAVAVSARSSHDSRASEPARRLFISFYAGHIAGKLTEDTGFLLGNSVVNRHFGTPDDESLYRQIVASFAAVGGPNTLAIPPCLPPSLKSKGGTLDSLLSLDHENFLGRHLSQVLVGGVSLDSDGGDVRERLWAANDMAGVPRATFTEMYGASEVIPLAVSCVKGEGLHPLPGVSYVEVVDLETGRPVANGERGYVVVTGIREGSRFLRYLIGDEADWTTDPCVCGRTGPRLRNVQRVVDLDRMARGCAAGGIG